MEKRRRNEGSDKKDKDRGELIKIIDKLIQKKKESAKEDLQTYPEGGDSDQKGLTNQNLEKMRINILVKKPTNDDTKAKHFGDESKRNKYAQDKPHPELELRKRIRDKYTLKLKSPVNKNDLSNVTKKADTGSNVKVINVVSETCKAAEHPKKQVAEETTQTKPSAPSSAKTEVLDTKLEKKPSKQERNSAKADKTKSERNSARRKPMIKTIMSKNGSVRIYKAVTFVDQKRKLTPLEIKIPVDATRKQKASKFTDTSSLKIKPKPSESRTSIKEKPAPVRKKTERRRDRKIRYAPSVSPDRSVRETRSPPTEVARWAPASIDEQTKPYYEAWVNTTLAAISKNSKKNKQFYEKQRDLLLSFQKAFEERPATPELIYENFADEKYTGRIKITQR